MITITTDYDSGFCFWFISKLYTEAFWSVHLGLLAFIPPFVFSFLSYFLHLLVPVLQALLYLAPAQVLSFKGVGETVRAAGLN